MAFGRLTRAEGIFGRLTRAEGIFTGDCAVCDIVRRDDEPAADHLALDHCREGLSSAEVRTSAHHLSPATVRSWLVVTIAVGVCGYHQIAACLVKERPPEIVAGPLPGSKVSRIFRRVRIVRMNVPWILRRVRAEDRNMTECHKERSRGDVLALQSVPEPLCLGFPVGSAVE